MAEIAVILPVRNRAGSVRQAIDSVLAQDFADFELLVVDDGSTDSTADVVAAVQDPRIRLIRLPHGGANAARNAGIRAAKAPLISFLDSDDEYLPAKVGFVTRFFAENPETDVLVDSFVRLETKQSGSTRRDRSNPVIFEQERFRRALFTRRLWKATPAISARKSALERAGLFDETLKRLQDFDLLVRLSASARCAATNRVLWTKHVSADAISSTGDTLIPAYIELARRHPEFLNNPAYRPGIARDVTRQLRRFVTGGRVARAASSIRSLTDAFGWRRTGQLLIGGLRPLPKI